MVHPAWVFVLVICNVLRDTNKVVTTHRPHGGKERNREMRNSLVIARPVSSPVPQEIIDLADKALDIGYRVLANRVQKVSAFHEGAALLKEIGISVYDLKSVDWYKRVAIFKTKYLMYAKFLIYTAILIPLVYVFARISTMFKEPSVPGVFFGVLALVAGGLAIISLTAYVVRTISSDYHLSWDDTSIESYDKPIPEEVLRTAITIKDAWPKSELVVEELRAKKRVVDPFLFVKYKGVRLYVSVWDEPKFTGKLQ